MRVSVGRIATSVGVASMCLGFMGTIPGAAAASSGVAFANAHFGGYASATELHLGAVTSGTTTLAEADQAFSGASTNTAGLTTGIRSETGVVVQPALAASTNSYGRGSGLEIGAGTSTVAAGDPNQITLAGLAQASAAPNGPAQSKAIGPLNLAPVASASLVDGKAAATWFPASCPIGQPLSYGNGNLASASLLEVPTTTSPVVATGGSGVTSTSSYDFLSSNGDGTFGLSSVGEETVAPATVNLLNLITVKVTVAGANPSAPIDLLARTTGESTGSQVKLLNGGLVTVTLQATGASPVTIAQVNLSNPSTLGSNGFLHIAVNTSQLGSSLTSLSDAIAAVVNGTVPPNLSPIGNLFATGGPLNGLLGQTGLTASTIASMLANVSLGSIDIDAVPHAIGGPVTSAPTLVGGTQAAGAIDLVHLSLALNLNSVLNVPLSTPLGSISIADLRLGHLEAAATDASPIACTIPVIKTANPTSVTAGNSFTYNISVPDPAYVDTIACNLTNMKVVDTITDVPGKGNPTFTVTSANDGGVVDQTSANSATVTWNGLSYTAGSAPIGLAIGITVPGSSPAGVIQDTVNVAATTAGCTGGTSGVANVGSNVGLGANSTGLTGSYTLQQPSVGAVAVTSPASAPPTAAAQAAAPKTLPFTGAMGGIWQPFAGLGALALGGGTLALVRRARRINQG